MLARGAVHVYETVIPLFVVSWLVESQTFDLGLASVAVTAATVGLSYGFTDVGMFGVGTLGGAIAGATSPT